jgi:hypothetical protein
MHRGFVALLLLLMTPLSASAQEVDMPTIRQSIESVLEMETWRDAERLPRVTLNQATGDVTVVFGIRRPVADDARQIVGGATDDIFTILWATYSSSMAGQIRSATVLGTYAVVGRYDHPKEIPLIRAVLSANRATNFDWSHLYTYDPRDVLDTWWVDGELVGDDHVSGGRS